MKEAKKKRNFKRYMPLYLMGLPGLAYLFLNNYMPLAGLVVAFKNYQVSKGIFGSDWCGFKNFKYLFSTSDAFVITRNTLLYNIAFIVIGTFCSVFVAIFLASIAKKAGQFYQAAILLPYLISWVIISYLVYAFFSAESGFINNTILRALGIEEINWYNEPKYWPAIIIFVYLWHSVGYSSIVYYASIVGIDPGYYEAAEIDGATEPQLIHYVTIPCIRPIIITMVLLAVGRIFYSDFGLFYQVPMNSGSLYSTTNVIDTYVYRGLLQQGNIGMSAAAGVYQSVVGFIVVMIANMSVRKLDPDSAFF